MELQRWCSGVPVGMWWCRWGSAILGRAAAKGSAAGSGRLGSASGRLVPGLQRCGAGESALRSGGPSQEGSNGAECSAGRAGVVCLGSCPGSGPRWCWQGGFGRIWTMAVILSRTGTGGGAAAGLTFARSCWAHRGRAGSARIWPAVARTKLCVAPGLPWPSWRCR